MALEPTRNEVDALLGSTLLEFGTSWCPHCQHARPLVDHALSEHPELHHLRVEDGKGQPLGRSFHVKLWPTLILLRDGREVTRVVRPREASDLSQALLLLR